MNNYESITARLEPQMKTLNGIIRRCLTSDNHTLAQIVENYLKTEGKQLRPILVLLSAELYGEINDKVLAAGAAIEILHNASLIHDDVIDQSATRRGVPTINSVWDNHMAVLVGDFFVSKALTCAVGTGDINIISSLSEVGAYLAVGEINQIDNAFHGNITENDYMNIISHKTASLFTSCVNVGAFGAGASENELHNIQSYAHLFGMAFQMKDDIFDYFHNPQMGKPTGNDLREGKVTLPLIYALEHGENNAEMRQLVKKTSLNDSEIDRLVEYAKQNGGIEYTNKTMENLRDKAFACLEPYGQNKAVDDLKALFNFIITRDK
ncbi:MAG: polyprenyl synthetase family protein [Muribaculaceae bacterium]|nr:polyprenyl synthetase family protein [Muribaculaceae bacterium]